MSKARRAAESATIAFRPGLSQAEKDLALAAHNNRDRWPGGWAEKVAEAAGLSVTKPPAFDTPKSSSPRQSSEVVIIDGKPYRWTDDGRQNRLVPHFVATNPQSFDPLERERQMNRIDFLRSHPIGAAFDLMARGAHLPSGYRDVAMHTGAVIDAVGRWPSIPRR